MKTSIGLMLLLQAVLIFLNAVFACAEIAVLQVNEAKLQKLSAEGNKKARRLQKLTEQPARFLASIQVAITLSGFLGSAFAAENFSGLIADKLISMGAGIPRGTIESLSVIVITLILSYFTLIFGELVPKRLAMKKAEQLSLAISGLVSFISKAFAPIVWLLTVSTNGVLRLMGIDPREDDQAVGEEDIRLMVEAGSESGGIDHEEGEFIKNVFEFDDISAEDIATHRMDVDMLWLEEPMDTWENTINSTRHSYYPVCRDSADNVLGVLDAKDYFRLKSHDRESIMAKAVKPAYFVPETIKADLLFRNMRRDRSSIAVVLDEYGGLVGIVTLNDLLEQLVGELRDGGDEDYGDEPRITQESEGRWLIEGNPELEDIEEAAGIKLDYPDCDTLTGIVFDTLGLIPDDGEQDIEVKTKEFSIHVMDVFEHKIRRAEIYDIVKPEELKEE